MREHRDIFKKIDCLKKRAGKKLTVLLLLFPAALLLLPVVVLLSGSLMDTYEMTGHLSALYGEQKRFITWSLIPDYLTFAGYGRLLFFTPQFFVLFWNSVKITGCILAGQLLVGVPAAWAFAVYPVKGSRFFFSLYIALMLLPFQVMMLSNYLILNRLSLLNTHAAVILPAVFSTFPVFLCYSGFRSIPIQLLESARMDGAGELTIFARMGLPLGKSGLLSALVLGFLEYWNMVEQPMAFLEDKALWPLSLYLPEITWLNADTAFCASVITLIPALFVFLLGQDYLEQGILYSGLKE